MQLTIEIQRVNEKINLFYVGGEADFPHRPPYTTLLSYTLLLVIEYSILYFHHIILGYFKYLTRNPDTHKIQQLGPKQS